MPVIETCKIPYVQKLLLTQNIFKNIWNEPTRIGLGVKGEFLSEKYLSYFY